MVDPVADLLTRIRNAGMAKHESTRMPHSKMRERVLKILKDEGYIAGYSVEEKGGVHKGLVVNLSYQDDSTVVIRKLERISKPGRRVYVGASDIPKINNGMGISIVSTSKGVITDREARRLNVGGEVLCEIW